MGGVVSAPIKAVSSLVDPITSIASSIPVVGPIAGPVAGYITGGPLGAALGAGIGNWIGNKITGGPKAKAQKLRQQAQQLLDLATQYDGMGNFQMPKFGNASPNSPMNDERFIFSIQNAKGPDVETFRKLLKAQAGVKEAVADWAGKLAGAGTAARSAYQQARGSLLTPQEVQQSILKLRSAEAQKLLRIFTGKNVVSKKICMTTKKKINQFQVMAKSQKCQKLIMQ